MEPQSAKLSFDQTTLSPGSTYFHYCQLSCRSVRKHLESHSSAEIKLYRKTIQQDTTLMINNTIQSRWSRKIGTFSIGAKPDHSKQTPSTRLLGGAAVSKLTTTITATPSKNATRDRCINEAIIEVASRLAMTFDRTC